MLCKTYAWRGLMSAVLLSCVSAGQAQTAAPANAAPAVAPVTMTSAPPSARAATMTARSMTEEDTLYRIGPGDVIDIRIFGRPEMSKEARVDNLGRIRPIFIQEEITVACMTEVQLARLLEEKYRKYLRSPQVDVFVKDYQSQPIAVIGAVMQPGRFKLQRRIRLLELLTQAGGANGNSGTTVNLIRNKEYSFCAPKPVNAIVPVEAAVKVSATPDALANNKKMDDPFAGQLITLNLRDVLLGRPESNIYVEPGDIVSVPDADQVFLTGGVMHPGPIPMRQAIRLSEAIGMAGGFFADVSKKSIRVSRQIPGSTQREIHIVDFEAIEKKKAEDWILQPSDVIEVTSSMAKGIGRSLLGIIAPTAAQLPMRALRPY